MKEYKNALTEVYEILNSLEEADFKKIPEDVLHLIEKNRNTEYVYVLDNDLELSEQAMLPQTKAILFNLFRDYLCTEEQRASIVRMQREERLKNEQRKRLSYHKDVFSDILEPKKVEDILPVEIKHENILHRIFSKIRSCFVR